MKSFVKNNMNMKSIFLYSTSVILIFIDVYVAFYCDEFYRIVINYIIIPIIAIITILTRHKSYWILMAYELLISILVFHELLGLSVFTYFFCNDIWHIINSICIDPSLFGLSKWFQPLLIYIIATLVALVNVKLKQKK